MARKSKKKKLLLLVNLLFIRIKEITKLRLFRVFRVRKRYGYAVVPVRFEIGK